MPRDAAAQLRSPTRLLGRDRERERLLDALARAAGGGVALVTVVGPAGMGKTALVQGLRAEVSRRHGRFVVGGHDQLGSAPYAGLASALDQGIRAALTGPAAARDATRTSIRTALGDGLGVIREVVPGLARLAGDVDPPPAVQPAEEQNRFRLAMLRLLGALTDPASPLVLFLDDLQWADDSTVSLLAELVAAADLRALLVVTAARSEQRRGVAAQRALADAAAAAGVDVDAIELAGLPPEHTTALVADVVGERTEEIERIAGAVQDSHRGNPFETLRRLRSLSDRGLLRRAGGTGAWTWTQRQLDSAVRDEGVAGVVRRAVARLPVGSREAVDLASCLASEISATRLAVVLGIDEAAVGPLLAPAIEQALLLADGEDGGLRFVHDQLREAVYERIGRTERARLHRRIGRRLLAAWREHRRAAWLFDGVRQLDRAVELGLDPEDPAALAADNLEAGAAALRATAWARAVEYLQFGVALLVGVEGAGSGPLRWSLRRSLAVALQMSGRVEEADQQLDWAADAADGVSARAEIHRLRSRLLVQGSRYVDAVEEGLSGLALFGHALPPAGDAAAWAGPAEAEVLRMAEQMSDVPLSALARRPPMTDERDVAELELLLALTAPAYAVPHVMAWTVTRMLNLCLERGNGPGAALAYAFQGTLCAMGGDANTARALGQVAEELLAERDDPAQRAMVQHLVVNFIHPWCEPLDRGMAAGAAAIEDAVRQGLFDYAGWLAFNDVMRRLVAGQPLDRVALRARGLGTLARDLIHYADAAHVLQGLRLAIVRLTGDEGERAALVAEGANEASLLDSVEHYRAACLVMRLFWARTAWLLGDVDGCRRRLAEAAPDKAAAVGTVAAGEGALFEALVLADEFATADEARRAAIDAELDELREQAGVWAAGCEANHGYKPVWIGAEIALLRGDLAGAARRYDEALALTGVHGPPPAEGLLCERAAALARRRGLDGPAGELLGRAREAYRRWGATAVVARLDADVAAAGGSMPAR